MSVQLFLETWQSDHLLQYNSLEKYREAIKNICDSLQRHQPFIVTREIKSVISLHYFTSSEYPYFMNHNIHLYRTKPYIEFAYYSFSKLSDQTLNDWYSAKDFGIVTPNFRNKYSLFCACFYKSISDYLNGQNENSVRNAFIFICTLGNAPTMIYIPRYYNFFESLILMGLPIEMLDGIQNIDCFRRKLWRSSIVVIDLVEKWTSADVSTIVSNYTEDGFQQRIRSSLCF